MTIGNVFKQSKDVSPEELQARAVIVSLAQQMGVGQRAGMLCPACEGGKSKERSLSLGVEQSGEIRFYCHRSACGFQGRAYTTPGMAPAQTQTPPISHVRPLDADLFALGEKDIEYFESRFHIPGDIASENIRRTGQRYAVAIRSPRGAIRGWITRRPWGGSPADTESARADSGYASKALTFMETDDPVLSWYGDRITSPRVLLVEDPISAMRALSFFEDNNYPLYRVCALMGTGVNASKIAEIQREAGIGDVHIALDADATGQAFAMARKYGQAFKACRVVVLSKDIKDMADDELSALPLN